MAAALRDARRRIVLGRVPSWPKDSQHPGQRDPATEWRVYTWPRTTRSRDDGVLEQLGDRFAAGGHDWIGSSGGIVPHRIEIDAEIAIHGRREILRSDGALGDRTAVTIGGADHLAVPQPTPGHQHRHHGQPVMTAGLFVDLWRTTELAHHQNQRTVEPATLLEVFDEGVQHAIDSRQQGRESLFDPAPANIVAVMVKVAPRATHEHERNARFDETPCQQGLFADAFSPVLVA